MAVHVEDPGSLRIAALEASVRRLRLWCAGSSLLVVAACAAAAVGPRDDVVRAQRFEVLSKGGEVFGVMGVPDEGRGALLMFTTGDGEASFLAGAVQRAEVRHGFQGGGQVQAESLFLAVRDEGMEPWAGTYAGASREGVGHTHQLSASPRQGVLRVAGPDGLAILLANETGTGLHLEDADSSNMLNAGCSSDGSGFSIERMDGWSAGLGTTSEKAWVALTSGDHDAGGPELSIELSQDGPGVTALDSAGEVIFEHP